MTPKTRLVAACRIAVLAFIGAVAIVPAGASDGARQPMSLLPETFSSPPAKPLPAPPAPAVSAPAATAPAFAEQVPDAAGRMPLLKQPQRDAAISELRAIAERNAARAGGGGASHAARLRQLGATHGKDALKQIEAE